jgi:hypothetical protein
MQAPRAGRAHCETRSHPLLKPPALLLVLVFKQRRHVHVHAADTLHQNSTRSHLNPAFGQIEISRRDAPPLAVRLANEALDEGLQALFFSGICASPGDNQR